MYVWSKRIVIGLLSAFLVLFVIFLYSGPADGASTLKMHTTRWITLNYAGLVIWLFVWMYDQARVRGKNVWVWLVPFVFAPMPVLMAYVLFLQRRLKP
jgi:hypothetical protein